MSVLLSQSCGYIIYNIPELCFEFRVINVVFIMAILRRDYSFQHQLIIQELVLETNKKGTLRFVCINARSSHFRLKFTSLTFDRWIQLSVRHQIIYSHLGDCTRVPWESSTSMVISLALVNGSYHWPVIKWFLSCSMSRPCNRTDRIVLCGRWDKDAGYLLSVHCFPQVTMEFCMSPSMDPHLYVRGCAHIFVCMT